VHRVPQAMVEWDVDVLPATSYLNRAHKLAPLCGLIFKSSAGHHPLLAGALGALHAILCPAHLSAAALQDFLYRTVGCAFDLASIATLSLL